MVLRFKATMELSSLTASSTISRLGDFLRSRIAVLKSFLSFPFLQEHITHIERLRLPDFGSSLAKQVTLSSCTLRLWNPCLTL